VQLLDDAKAAALAAILPQSISPGFTPQSKHNEQFISRVNASANRPLLTYCLIAINLLVFIATVHGGADWLNPRGTVEVAWGSNFGLRTANGEWWRLLTSMFIHFGVLHLFFNMWALWVYGRLFERLYGKLFFGLVYGVSGVVGGLTSTAWHPAANSAGASGAIFGILGALIGTQLATRGNLIPREISRRILSATLALVVLSVSASLRKSGIDYAAHLGGLATGIILGLAVQRESDLYADGDFVRPQHQKR
jgi:rhomboid protease GluP